MHRARSRGTSAKSSGRPPRTTAAASADPQREPALGADQRAQVDLAELGLLVDLAGDRPGRAAARGAHARAGDPNPLRDRLVHRLLERRRAGRAVVGAQQPLAQLAGVPAAHRQVLAADADRVVAGRPSAPRRRSARATSVLRWMRTNPAAAQRSSSVVERHPHQMACRRRCAGARSRRAPRRSAPPSAARSA